MEAWSAAWHYQGHSQQMMSIKNRFPPDHPAQQQQQQQQQQIYLIEATPPSIHNHMTSSTLDGCITSIPPHPMTQAPIVLPCLIVPPEQLAIQLFGLLRFHWQKHLAQYSSFRVSKLESTS
jgi:hypothetical protein